jgi:hypothetical protein
MRNLDGRATGQGETQGAYRNPAPLPDGRMLASYAADATNLEQFNGNFDIVVANPVTGSRVDLISDSADLLWPVAVYARQNHGVFVSRPDEANAHTRVYTDEGRRDRSQITFMDVPMLVSLLFQNTRTGRILPEASGVFELWESLPPEQGVTSFGNGGQFVTSDQYGDVYVRRQRLGSPFLFENGSARALIRGGIPLTFSTTVQLQGDEAPTVHFLREELQFYPGEYARQSFRRELFNGLCGGCHGSVSGRELEVAPNPDILTRASSVAATTADATDLRTALGSPEAPPFE